ncbi:AAA family ATPase [Pseudonocardia broussonetiae]|uniref:AAA family ATPase n=1 Tax=Pseudonocardia broussonetiae TaxID=2736640 RepID=A0A6M6JXF1_9PSEU|nr:AAA family ATPase [Pseudonocardia broussonetiae]QJY51239.1 AAA family ATPase [Pseudonocardia broussonetiae]
MRIVAVGGPKGGAAKTTTAVTLAAVAARSGLSVLLVDGDANRSASDIADAAGDALPLDVADGQDPRALRRLRELDGYDLALVDLPGAREGAFEAVLQGDGRPVADLLVVPSAPEAMDLRPTLRVVRGEVIPLGLPYLLAFTRVSTPALPRARERQAELRGAGLVVAETVVRRYAVYDEAVERGGTVLDIPGLHSYARLAEADYRALADEVLAAVDLQLRKPGRAVL